MLACGVRAHVSPAAALVRHGTPEFRRITLALFAAGFATFALLYCVQPLMPVFAQTFNVGATESSLPLSLTTGLLAPAMMAAGAYSEARGRKRIMVASLGSSALLMFVAALAPTWGVLLAARALQGIAFAGLPAVSMAYLSEEVHPTSLGLAVGLMIGGNGLGGMMGRIATSLATDRLGWRLALAAIAALGVIATVIFWRILPPSQHFTPRPLRAGALVRTFVTQLRDWRLAPLFAEAFLLMGCFVTAYNYVTFHLLAPPYSLSPTIVGSIFIVYLIGIFAAAWIGSLAARAGRGKMLATMIALMLLGVVLMASRPTAAIVLGIATLTFGFFGAHSVASTWVGIRATHAKAQASGLYFFFYYVGSSLAGWFGGMFWERFGWAGVIGFLTGMLTLSFLALAVLGEHPELAPAATRSDVRERRESGVL
jgi:MFS transporter, YNFM family, putative membrane transport protein